MTCEKMYEVKIKMLQEQWLQLKVEPLVGYDMKNIILWDGINLWWEGESTVGGFLPVGRNK